MRTVAVVPFEVPGARAPGLGLGLAGLVHSSLRAEGTAFVIARAFAQPTAEPAAGGAFPHEPRELEGLVSPEAWKTMSGRSNDLAQMRIDLLVTGRFEAPEEGSGQAELVAFVPASGDVVFHTESLFSDHDAGAGLVRILQELAATLGFDVGDLEQLATLGWEPLESALRAEAALAGSPSRTEEEGQLAALVHLSRALGDAPSSGYLATRLAALAEHVFWQRDPVMVATATRALAAHASDSYELGCAAAVGQAAAGDAERAAATLRALTRAQPALPRAHALLARLAREGGNAPGALAILDAAAAHLPEHHPLLDNERGIALLDEKRRDEAASVLFTLLDAGLLSRIGWLRLLELARSDGQEALAGRIVDRVLGDVNPSADALAQALELIAHAEPPGVARTERARELAMRVLRHERRRPELRVGVAHTLIELGDTELALEELRAVQRLAPTSAPAALAAELLLAIEDPAACESIRAALRAAHAADAEQLAQIAERARWFSKKHDVWTAHLACAIAERRQGRIDAARAALDRGLATSPASPALLEERARLEHAPSAPAERMGISLQLKRMWQRWSTRGGKL